MADIYYPGIAAGDAATIGTDGKVSAIVTPNATYQVFEINDTSFSTPLQILTSAKLPSGPTGREVPVGALPILPDVYVVSPNYSHYWKSGTLGFRRDSQDALLKAVADALALMQAAEIRIQQLVAGGAGGGGGIVEIPAEYVTDTELAAYMTANLRFTGLVRITKVSDGSFIWSTTATANATNAELRDRSTHTGTQPISSIDGLAAQLTNTVQPSGIMVARVYNFSTNTYPERGILPTGAHVTWFGPIEPPLGNGYSVSGDVWEPRDA